MPDSIYFRTLQNDPNNQSEIVQQWNFLNNKDRTKNTGYIGGLTSRPIEQAGVHKAIEANYLPSPPRRDRRIFIKAPIPVYTQNPRPVVGLKLSELRKPPVKLKPVFETLFEEDRIW